jgi:hypothetical protein
MQRADWHRAGLDVREQTCLIGGGRDGLRLFLRGLRSTASSRRGFGGRNAGSDPIAKEPRVLAQLPNFEGD